ncbi:MAG: uracil-DNA glycosylase [Candidatus Cloacimonetes bacterium]|nr:uracil-DNA glycosylase [Candidatus Cloacimonadota bacterium]
MSLRALKQYIELYHYYGLSDFFLESQVFQKPLNTQPQKKSINSNSNYITRESYKDSNNKQIYDFEYDVETTDFTFLQRKYANCFKCSFSKSRWKFVYGEGQQNAQCMLIGNPPITDENANGKPFVGHSGDLFNKMMASIGIKREDLYITNIIKCKPNYIDYSEIQKCMPYLLEQIRILKPKIILVMGDIAANALFTTLHHVKSTSQQINLLKENIDYYRLHQGQLYQNIPIYVTYNPFDLLRNIDLKKLAWEDLKLFRDHFLKIKNSE